MKKLNKSTRVKLEMLNLIEKSNYVLVGEYINTNTKINLKCPNNHEWSVLPTHFRNGVRCPKCQNNCKEQARDKFLKMLVAENYICFDEYKGNKIKVKLKCPEGHLYSVRPNDFMTGHRCSKCSNLNKEDMKQRKLKSFEDLKQIAQERNFEILGEYINTNTKITMKCPHGHVGKYNIGHFKNGFGCVVCAGTCPEEAAKDLIIQAENEGYKVLESYVNTSTKIKIQCPNGHIYKVKPNCFKNGNRCPVCNNQSHGENIAIKTLLKANIEIEVQKQFDGLIGTGGGNLRFDIYIPKNNTLIEIQGEQHYKTIPYLISPKLHDGIKREYCDKNNIKLIEIEYSPIELGQRKAVQKVKKEILNVIKTLSI